MTLERKVSDKELRAFQEMFAILAGVSPSQVTIQEGTQDYVASNSEGNWIVTVDTDGQLWGVIHEASHVLFSTFDWSSRVAQHLRDGRIHHIANVLEDARIDRKGSEHFGQPLYDLHRNTFLAYEGEADNLDDAIMSAAFDLNWPIEGRDPDKVVSKFGEDIRAVVKTGDKMAPIKLAMRIAYYLDWLAEQDEKEQWREPDDKKKPKGKEPQFASDYENEGGGGEGQDGDDEEGGEQGGQPGEGDDETHDGDDEPSSQPQKGDKPKSKPGKDPDDLAQRIQQAGRIVHMQEEYEEQKAASAERQAQAAYARGMRHFQAEGYGDHAVRLVPTPEEQPIVLDNRVRLFLDEYGGAPANLARGGMLEPQRAWRANMGDLRIFRSHDRSKGRMFLLIDMSGSMGGINEPESNLHLAFQIAGALAQAFPGLEAMGYYAEGRAANLVPLTAGRQPKEPKSGQTPDCSALLYLHEEMLGQMEDTAIVFICDGGPNSGCHSPAAHTNELTRSMRERGAKFVTVVVGAAYNRKPDGAHQIRTMDEVHRLSEVMAELRERGY